jgi:hypothetical protein
MFVEQKEFDVQQTFFYETVFKIVRVPIHFFKIIRCLLIPTSL